jgi:hypothetical protein
LAFLVMKFSAFIDWCVIVFIGTVMLIMSGCGGNRENPPTNPTEFRTDRGIAVFPSPIAPDLPELIHIELDKHNARAVKAGLQPLDPTTLVIEIMPQDAGCEHGGYKVAGGCVAGRFLDNLNGKRERVQITAEGLRIPGYEGLQNEWQHQTYWRQDREKYVQTMHHPPPHPLAGFE